MTKRNNTRRLSKRSVPSYVDPATVKYTGPLSDMNHDSTVITLYDNATVTANSGGAISAAFNNNPSGAANFNDMAASWDEYRVLGVKFSYDPNNVVNTSTVSGFNGYNMIVHAPVASSPATLAAAASMGVSRRWNAFRRFVREWRMSEISEAMWLDTTSPASTSDTMLLYAVGGTASNYYGNILLEYVVQFRSHRY
jgi:hypothetical protein